ncbi:hypothetical protein HWV62_32892 [Athelia sp. TMB]|nr:hypothetical protein HWV62_32892 [Athelia sp. TMB]
MDREAQLRDHIHHLLYDYAKTHLTTDYDVFTRIVVPALLSDVLAPIPVDDPKSLTLPEDPWDALTRIFKLTELNPYNETFAGLRDEEGLAFLRKVMARPPGKPRTERVWGEEDSAEWRAKLCRPMSPVLTLRAIRETPKLGLSGNKSVMAVQSLTLGDVVQKLKVTEVEEMPQKQVKMEDVLDVRPSIDKALHPEMLSLFKSIPCLSPVLFPTKRSSHTDCFLRSETPPHTLPKEEFVPIFCRANRMHGRFTDSDISMPVPIHASMPGTLQDLVVMLPPVRSVDDRENDMHKQHMAVVSGWEAFVPPSPSSLGTPSLRSGTSDVDELEQFLVSPLGSQKLSLIQELENSKIDTIAIPGSERIGGSLSRKTKSVGEGQTLSTFLAPLLSRSQPMKDDKNTQDSHPRIVTTPRSSPRSAIGLSILGQPSSLLESTQPRDYSRDRGSESSEIGLDTEVKGVYAEIGGQGPTNIIMDEQLDEKGSLLMNVPHLQSPTIHNRTSAFFPQTWKEVVTSASLKKATGLKPLNMELSWRPFQFGSKIPTNEEVAKVEGVFDWKCRTGEPSLTDIDAAHVEKLLGSVEPEGLSTGREPFWQEGDDISLATLLERSVFEPILTRSERRRVAGHLEASSEEEVVEVDEVMIVCADRGHENLARDVAFSNTEQLMGEYVGSMREGFETAKWSNTPDDSGISLPDPADYYEQQTIDEYSLEDGDKENLPPQRENDIEECFYHEEDESLASSHLDDILSRGFVPLSFGSGSGSRKRSIISALTNHECSVELTERETLDGVDIIIDPHTAIIFASLGSLPSQGETLSQRLGELSWRYSRLLVILEAFSSSAAYKRYKPRSLVNPYTAPGLRAIQKLRRSFAIMDGCGSKRSGTSIHLAFADTVEQAAMFTRCFGDCSEANDTTGGVIWGSRKWLDSEEQEDERELGRFPGMNMFSALTLICQMPLHVFLDLSTPERTSVLEQLIGYDRAMAFNEELESRYHDMRDVTSSSNKDDS